MQPKAQNADVFDLDGALDIMNGLYSQMQSLHEQT